MPQFLVACVFVSKAEVRRPKTKCCESSTRCGHCPVRLLKEGNLPDGYAVRHRRLVRDPEPESKKARRAKISKAELDVAVKRTKKARKKQARKTLAA